MVIKVTDNGEKTLIDWMLNSTGTNIVLRLYKNDYTPVFNSIAANFTQADFTGYASVTLTRGNWNTPVTNVLGAAEIQYNTDVSWTTTTSQSVYGYYVTDLSGNVLFAERFSQTRALVNGDSLTISPRFTLKSEN